MELIKKTKQNGITQNSNFTGAMSHSIRNQTNVFVIRPTASKRQSLSTVCFRATGQWRHV